MSGKQTIQCAVKTCKYHDRDGKCSLNSIQVSPDAASPKVDSAEESMCASFEVLGR
jgi:ethanolamine utilization protein EutQ (cupin superfamily)